MTLSTCIVTEAMQQVFSTSVGSSCFLPFVNPGISSLQPYRATESDMSNLLSDNTVSPGSNFERKCDCSVTSLSLLHPPQPLAMNEIVPCGVIPIKYLMVLCEF